jgi:hypothetical protein
MTISLGNCEYDLTTKGLRLLRYNIYADSWVDVIDEKSRFRDPY